MGGRQRTSLFMEKGRKEEEQAQATKAKKGYKKRK